MKKLLFVSIALINSPLLFCGNEASAQNKNSVGPRVDTLVFKAANYVIQPNDKLDDLLQRLPGITIDSHGKMYAQREEVQQLLVDGKEFFSDDPTSAANVLRADKVDTIKIYWRWSDQASFTGVEDGAKIKTINVILKKE